MSPLRAAPPAADSCLGQPYSSSPTRKGGTLVDEQATDLAAHLRRSLFPALCRPGACRCGSSGLHGHGWRERHPRQLVVDGWPVAVVTIRVFRCTACSATWRILPAFLARHLWRSWDVIERETSDTPRGAAPAVPPRTVQRWRARLAQSARLLAQVLAVAGGALRGLAQRAGLDCSRAELLLAFDGSLGALALLLHRLAPGIRLM